jgi:two-component system, LuxR family, response regulator FixJ
MSQAIPSKDEIFIVDDDVGVRESLALVFSMNGYEVLGLSDGASLLTAARQRTPACIILDVHMPGRSGLDILRELNADAYSAPILIISGQGDIAMAVEAIKNGALDFIEKPFDAKGVLSRVRDAIDAWRRRRDAANASSARAARFPGRELLTQREVDVLDQIASGASSKEAGRELGISFRTVEVHRARIMEKLGAKNAVDLARIVFSEGRGV